MYGKLCKVIKFVCTAHATCTCTCRSHVFGYQWSTSTKITFCSLHKENISTLISQYKNNEIFLSLIISMFAKTFEDYTVNLPKYLPPKFYNFTLQPSKIS